MPQHINDVLQLLLRWAHVIAGIIWIGHLYFFNWVNAHFVKVLDGPTKKMIIPELAPRALFWFRWGAAWTWITGILLGGLVYYNIVMKKVANVVVANVIVLVLLAAVYLFLEQVGRFGGRSLYIHTGMILGTMMAMNVWMIIWPYQKRIIAATKEGTAPNPTEVAQAGLRSRHNTYMSVPLVFTMISNHYPTVFGNTNKVLDLVYMRDLYLIGVFILGFAAVRWMYGKSGKVAGM